MAGRRLIYDHAKKKYEYAGQPIPFDPEGVWPMMDDPDLTLYPPGSLRETVGLMYALDLAARELMQTPSGVQPGTTAGPCFSLPGPE